MFLPGKSSPRSHRSQPFPGNLGQGQNYLLQTRQSVCPGRIQRETSNCTQGNTHYVLQKKNSTQNTVVWVHTHKGKCAVKSVILKGTFFWPIHYVTYLLAYCQNYNSTRHCIHWRLCTNGKIIQPSLAYSIFCLSFWEDLDDQDLNGRF